MSGYQILANLTPGMGDESPVLARVGGLILLGILAKTLFSFTKHR